MPKTSKQFHAKMAWSIPGYQNILEPLGNMDWEPLFYGIVKKYLKL